MSVREIAARQNKLNSETLAADERDTLGMARYAKFGSDDKPQHYSDIGSTPLTKPVESTKKVEAPTTASTKKVETTDQGSTKKVETTVQGSMKKVETTAQVSTKKVDTSVQGSMKKIETTAQGSTKKVETTDKKD